MIEMKKVCSFIIVIAAIAAIYLNKDAIIEKIYTYINPTPDIIVPEINQYKKDYPFLYIQPTEIYTPYNYEDLVSIFYTTLNNGWDDFTFYCPREYSNCINDITSISENKDLLANLNNYVHPYNSYTSIKTLYDSTGEVNIIVTHQYSDEEIKRIDKDIDSLIASVTNNNMTKREMITALHNKIIDESTYDSVRADNGNSSYDSARIQGPLYEHFAICSGYTDLMSVILDKIDVPNYKIASDNHIWNGVYLEKKWLHLDLTWDDPITSDGSNIISEDFLLVDNNKIATQDTDKMEHSFDKTIYLEFNK